MVSYYRGSLNPQSLKKHTPRNQASVLPRRLAQVPLTDPAKGTLSSSGTPFSNLKAKTSQNNPSGCAPSPTLFWAQAGRTSLTSSQGDPEILIREHGQSPGRSPTSNRQSDHSRPPHGGAYGGQER